MLVDVIDKLDDEKIVELINYAVFLDDEELEDVLYEYKTNEHLELYAFEDDGLVVGIVGFELNYGILEIKHMAVHPLYRGVGFGRGIILELIVLKNPSAIVAETDEEAVEYYRSVGFSIHSLDHIYSGIDRFKCVYLIDEDE